MAGQRISRPAFMPRSIDNEIPNFSKAITALTAQRRLRMVQYPNFLFNDMDKSPHYQMLSDSNKAHPRPGHLLGPRKGFQCDRSESRAVPKDRSFFDKIPPEIRFVIYELLISQPHLLLISYPLPTCGPLESLRQTCYHLNLDIISWSKGTSYKNDKLFGIVNPALSTVAIRIRPKVYAYAPIRPEYFYPFVEDFTSEDKDRHAFWRHWYRSLCVNERKDEEFSYLLTQFKYGLTCQGKWRRFAKMIDKMFTSVTAYSPKSIIHCKGSRYPSS